MKNNVIKDFIGVELQSVDTTGSIWSERQKFLYEKGIEVDKDDINNTKTFGVNWKMTLKTILLQIHHKCETFERMNKHLVLVIQTPLYEHMINSFNFDGMDKVKSSDCVFIHIYNLKEKEKRLFLSLDKQISLDAYEISSCLRLKEEKTIYKEDILDNLKSKLIEENRLKIEIK